MDANSYRMQQLFNKTRLVYENRRRCNYWLACDWYFLFLYHNFNYFNY